MLFAYDNRVPGAYYTAPHRWISEMKIVAVIPARMGSSRFPGKPLAEFRSRMEYLNGDEIIEYVKYGLGIRMRMSVDDGALVFTSAGYVWDIGLARLPIPTWLILGDSKITERAVSENEFYIDFNMVHPLFGRTFGYSGKFYIQEAALLSTTIPK